MSDVSVLSHEYKATSGLSQDINSALIVLKKVRLDLPGACEISPEQVESSRSCLVEILTALERLLTPARASQVDGATAARVPGALVARVQAERRGDLAYYLEDLRRAAAHLRDSVSAVTEADFALLDGLALAVDAETSRVFRRLMRR